METRQVTLDEDIQTLFIILRVNPLTSSIPRSLNWPKPSVSVVNVIFQLILQTPRFINVKHSEERETEREKKPLLSLLCVPASAAHPAPAETGKGGEEGMGGEGRGKGQRRGIGGREGEGRGGEGSTGVGNSLIPVVLGGNSPPGTNRTGRHFPPTERIFSISCTFFHKRGSL